jgi:hypothetical protein
MLIHKVAKINLNLNKFMELLLMEHWWKLKYMDRKALLKKIKLLGSLNYQERLEKILDHQVK